MLLVFGQITSLKLQHGLCIITWRLQCIMVSVASQGSPYHQEGWEHEASKLQLSQCSMTSYLAAAERWLKRLWPGSANGNEMSWFRNVKMCFFGWRFISTFQLFQVEHVIWRNSLAGNKCQSIRIFLRKETQIFTHLCEKPKLFKFHLQISKLVLS